VTSRHALETETFRTTQLIEPLSNAITPAFRVRRRTFFRFSDMAEGFDAGVFKKSSIMSRARPQFGVEYSVESLLKSVCVRIYPTGCPRFPADNLLRFSTTSYSTALRTFNEVSPARVTAHILDIWIPRTPPSKWLSLPNDSLTKRLNSLFCRGAHYCTLQGIASEEAACADGAGP
jgi:hypothetical protein